ncbi:MAG: cation transporter [Gemmataceae bacterium]|nr:cation transporter [Gemmataceae bacterium]
MRYSKVSLFVAAAAFLLSGMALGDRIHAQSPAPKASNTTITVPDMHCMGCAKKMANELSKVEGAGQILANVEATTVTVRTKSNQAPSPRALWEAVERAGYQPSRLEGPNGVFTSKPKS